MSYEEICREIANSPDTWLPGLLQRTVRTCATKPVFQDKAAMLRFVEKSWDMGGVGASELRVGDNEPKQWYFLMDDSRPRVSEIIDRKEMTQEEADECNLDLRASTGGMQHWNPE